MISRSQRQIFCVALIICLLNLDTPLGLSQQVEDKTNQKDSSPPIQITSDRLRSENGGQKIIFSGNVAVTKDDMVITSDIIEVYNSSDKKETDEIVAIGNVEIARGNKKAKGDRAVYLKNLQKIILTGNPKAIAWEGDNMIEGREMIFLLKKDRFVVNERVHAKLFPKKNNLDKLP